MSKVWPSPVLAHRLLTACTALLLMAQAVLATSCDDDGSPAMTVDAGPDGGTPACRPADCAALKSPGGSCMSGAEPIYSCERVSNDRCGWMNPRCPNETPDAHAHGSADAADAALDGGADAVADMGVD